MCDSKACSLPCTSVYKLQSVLSQPLIGPHVGNSVSFTWVGEGCLAGWLEAAHLMTFILRKCTGFEKNFMALLMYFKIQ